MDFMSFWAAMVAESKKAGFREPNFSEAQDWFAQGAAADVALAFVCFRAKAEAEAAFGNH